MRDFIKEQLREIGDYDNPQFNKGQLNEFDWKNVMSGVKDFISKKNKKVNKDFAKIISSKFDGEFADFLKKHLIKQGKRTNTLELITNYIQDDSNSNYDALFELIGFPMMQFFVKKTFGKDSLKGKIRQRTPFMKKVSTGNKDLDEYIFEAISKALNDNKIQNTFKKMLKDTLDDKMHDVVNDADYWNLMKDLTANVNESIVLEANLKDKARSIRDLFLSRMQRNKYRILDNILDKLPNLKTPIKREIRDELFDMDYKKIDHIVDSFDIDTAAEIVVIPIMKHIVKNSQGLYFKMDSYKDFIDLLEYIFINGVVLDQAKSNIKVFMKQSIRDAEIKAKEEAKRERERGREKRLKNWKSKKK